MTMKTWKYPSGTTFGPTGQASASAADPDADAGAEDEPDGPYDADPEGRCDVVGCYDEAVIRTVSSDPSISVPFDYCRDCADRQMERFADLMVYFGPSDAD